MSCPLIYIFFYPPLSNCTFFYSEYIFFFSLLQSLSRYSTTQGVRLVPYTWQHPAHTHCESAVNSQSVSCISAVFGPILELTQETGPFWQPPCQPVLHTAAPEPSVAHTYAHVHAFKQTNTHTQTRFFHVNNLPVLHTHHRLPRII